MHNRSSSVQMAIGLWDDAVVAETGAEEDFWAGGRLAHIERGPWAGRLLFITPDSREPWWIYVIDPSPIARAPGDHHADERDLPSRLSKEWGLEWIARGPEERLLERSRFGWRSTLIDTAWHPLAPFPDSQDAAG